MTQLRIRIWPDPDLRVIASPVTDFGGDLQHIIAAMAETMYAAKGAGLAATQVGIPLRLFVMDVTEDGSKLEVLINHQVLSTPEKKTLVRDEGCLSFPGIWETVPRYEWVKGTALDKEGIPFAFHYEGLSSRCVQHEGEHLDGKVMLDHFSRQKRRHIERQLSKRAPELLRSLEDARRADPMIALARRMEENPVELNGNGLGLVDQRRRP